MIKKITIILNYVFIIFLNFLIFIYIKGHYIYYNKSVCEYDGFEGESILNICLISIFVLFSTIHLFYWK